MRLPVLLLLATSTTAQFIADRSRLTTVRSPGGSNVTVSYRTPDGACTTAFDSQKQYTGWVNVPGDYPTNLFFWFVEARQPTDGLTIWLNGGPGSSSMYGFFTGNGPCEVVEKGLDQYDTVAREWGWDRASNMLFIDQPNQVGLSYNTPTNSTLVLPTEQIVQPPTNQSGHPSWALLNGTFSFVNGNQTANTTQIAALAVWHMVQGFMSAFPQYRPAKRGAVDINLFAESYGGRYGPVFAETFEEQNRKRVDGALSRNTTLDLHIVSLGIVNGCVDRATQVPQYPVFAVNNTYGVKALSNEEAEFYLTKYSTEGGCKDLLDQCFAAVTISDPDGDGDQAGVNDVCSRAQQSCDEIESPYYNSGRGAYDLASPLADPFPPQIFQEYLNRASIQQAIGSPVNYSMSSSDVYSEFAETGDIARGGNIPRLADLLNSGVRIGLIYGDRDYICNWYGGEAVSLSLAWQASADYGTNFSAAGYAPIIVNDSYIGGVVRQYGNLSFSRIYQAGHSVAAYQPETAFQVFARIIMGRSVSTGKAVNLSTYGTNGTTNATETAKLPEAPAPTCYVRAFSSTCDDEAVDLVNNDQGVVINGVLYSSSGDWPLLTSTSTSSSAPTSTETLTGVYTATETPAGASVTVPSFVKCAIVALFVTQLVLCG